MSESRVFEACDTKARNRSIKTHYDHLGGKKTSAKMVREISTGSGWLIYPGSKKKKFLAYIYKGFPWVSFLSSTTHKEFHFPLN